MDSRQANEMIHRRTPMDSSETRQAKNVLRWLEPRLLPLLDCRQQKAAYRRARRRKGRVARAQVRGISGVRADVRGSGDDAYGHHRLRAVVRDVVLPLIEVGAMEPGTARKLQQRLRGEFADLYREVERALARAANE
jgi:hypothetical protein